MIIQANQVASKVSGLSSQACHFLHVTLFKVGEGRFQIIIKGSRLDGEYALDQGR